LELLFRPKTVARAWCLFPMPWPKARHLRRRLFHPPFLTLLNNRLADGAAVEIVTDQEPYLEWLKEQVPGTGFDASVATSPARTDTKYARKWRAGGRDTFYEMTLTKREHLAPAVREEMPVQPHRVKRFDPAKFTLRDDDGEFHVRFRDFLYDPEREKGMVRVQASEDKVLLKFWIQIVKRGDEWRIGPAPACGFIPTRGVQHALDLVRDAATSA
ncbi:MAG: class I SAM-dependent methyltransferase, partial [Planctomycetota bacterium]